MILYFQKTDTDDVMSLEMTGTVEGETLDEIVAAYNNDGFELVEDHQEALNKLAKAREDIQKREDEALEAVQRSKSPEAQEEVQQAQMEYVREAIGKGFDAAVKKRNKLMKIGQTKEVANILTDLPDKLAKSVTKVAREKYIDEQVKKIETTQAATAEATSATT